jgi:membrane protein
LTKKIEKEHNLVHKLIALFSLMRSSFSLLKLNDPLRMGAATAFFTTFALPPILIIFTQFFRFIVDPNELSSELINRLGHILGTSSAHLVAGVLEAVSRLNQSWYITVFGFIFLMFVATTLFDVIKNSLGQIWDIRVRPEMGFIFKLRYRLRSLIIIFLAGFLFIVGLLFEGVQTLLGESIDEIWGGGGWFFNRVLNEIVFVSAVTIWLAFLFRFLTIGRPKWDIAFGGGLFTAVLFTIGKWILGYLLISSNIGLIYGPSGSMVLIMLFVFYSAMILYYGGCFVKVLSDAHDKPIRPVKEAFEIEMLEKSKD